MSEHEQRQHPEGSRPGDAEQAERDRERPQPRVWIGSLADYNAGRLHGDWVDAAVGAEELVEAARGIISSSREPGAEEWAILDYDGFAGFRVGEYDDLALVAGVARGIVEHGGAFAAWAELHDADPGMLAHFEDAHLGAFESRDAWIDQLLDDLGVDEASLGGDLPEWLHRYIGIDRAGIARDLELGGDVWVEDNPEGGVWVFDARG